MDLNFDFLNELILEDDVVYMRAMQDSDVDNLMYFLIHEPELWQYSLLRPDSKKSFEQYIETALSGRKERTDFPFVIVDKKSGKYAGSTRFYDISFTNKTLQIGYTWYGINFQGTGLNKHCKYLLLSYAFEKLEMERVEFRADNNNLRSIAAMKGIGCQVDGILRSNMPIMNSTLRRDSIVLSILKNEWFGNVKQHLESKL